MNQSSRLFVLSAFVTFSLSVFANEGTVFKSKSVLCSRVVKAATYKTDAIYSELNAIEGTLTFKSNAQTGETYVSVTATLPKKDNEIPFKSVGITVPSEALEFTDGLILEQTLFDDSQSSPNESLVIGKITVTVKNRIATISRSLTENLSYEVSIYQKPVATHRVYIDQITIQLDSNNRPIEVTAQESVVYGNQIGQPYTKEQSGTKISLKLK